MLYVPPRERMNGFSKIENLNLWDSGSKDRIFFSHNLLLKKYFVFGGMFNFVVVNQKFKHAIFKSP